MENTIFKRSFSIRGDNSSYIDTYKNKSKFVNEALTFYISYIEKVDAYKSNLFESKIEEALEGEFYNINLSQNKKNTNTKKYRDSSKKLEDNLLLAINE